MGCSHPSLICYDVAIGSQPSHPTGPIVFCPYVAQPYIYLPTKLATATACSSIFHVHVSRSCAKNYAHSCMLTVYIAVLCIIPGLRVVGVVGLRFTVNTAALCTT